jgi:transcriptional regulator with XRE-family HTH domain
MIIESAGTRLRCLFTDYHKEVATPQKIKYIQNPITLGDHIRNQRLQKGLLQKEVADLFQVTEDTITNWEKNRCKPLELYHHKIFEFLEIDPKTEPNTLGNRIKTFRLSACLTQSKLAQKLKVNICTIRSWENDEHVPQKKVLFKLSKIMKIV